MTMFRPSRRGNRHLDPRRRRKLVAAELERLEARTVPSTFTVTNTDDVVRDPDGTIQLNADGTPVAAAGSLRAAIVAANGDPNPIIRFQMVPSDPNHVYYQDDGVSGRVSRLSVAVTGFDDTSPGTTPPGADPDHPESWWTITPALPLPVLRTAALVDGYSQPGSRPNSLAVGDDAVLRIELAGAGLQTGDDCAVRGLVINQIPGGTGTGIGIGGKRESVTGNFIGTDVSGTIALANSFGIRIDHGTDCTIGGTSPAERNLISGNDVGLDQGPTDSITTVQGNYVGTDASGTRALGNRIGINAYTTYAIGGTAAGAGNVVSGNETGLNLIGYSTQNVVQGNLIGTDARGTSPVGNHLGVRVQYGGPGTIGGTAPGAGNVISGNAIGVTGGSGVRYAGNLVGTSKDGTSPLGNTVGFSIDGSDNVIGGTEPGARNVISGNVTGVALVGAYPSLPATGNVVAGNFIGTDVTGTRALGNAQSGWGVLLGPNSAGNTIGGSTAAARNVISGNAGDGIRVSRTGGGGDVPTRSLIQGNYIGTDVSGTLPLGNNIGVDLVEGTDNTVVDNVIAGAGLAGVYLGTTTGATTVVTGNTVRGNLIGTNRSGDTPLPNGVGVDLHAGGGVANNLIGGTTPGSANVISGNLGYGVVLGLSSDNRVLGNLIGTDATGAQRLGNGGGVWLYGGSFRNTIGGTAAGEANVIAHSTASPGIVLSPLDASGQVPTGNTFRGNSIDDNAGGGITLGAGANNGQRAPFLDSIGIAASTTLTGFGTPNTTVDFYANAAPDPSGFGQGQRYLGSTTVDVNGRFSAAGLHVSAGQWVTATATDAAGNTSAFARDVKAQALVNLTIAPAVTTSYLADEVTFTVTAQVLAPDAGNPDATLTFLDSTDRFAYPTVLGTAHLEMTPNGDTGTATFKIASLPLGARTITVGFSTPSGNFAPTPDAPQSATVTVLTPPPTTTTVAVATPDPVAGLPMTLTATVVSAPGRGSPTGTVTFYDGAVTLGTATLSGTGDSATASLPIASPAAGGHVIRATYGGTASSPIYPASSSLAGRMTSVAAPTGGLTDRIAVDGTGNLFVAIGNSGDVVEVGPDGTVTTLTSGFLPRSVNVAVDPSDRHTLYIAGEVSAPGSLYGYQTLVDRWRDGSFVGNLLTDDLPTPSNWPVPLAVDGAGNLYVAPAESGSPSSRVLYEFPTHGNRADFPAANLIRTSMLVADGAGKVYHWVGGQPVSQLQADGSLSPILNVPQFAVPRGFAADATGNLFIGGQQLYEGRTDGTYSPMAFGATGTLAGLPIFYSALTTDGAGNLYVDSGSGRYARFDLSTPNLTVRALASADVQSLLTQQGGSATILPTSDAVVSNVVQAVNGLSSPASGTETVTLDLGGGTFTTDTHVQAPAGVTIVITNGTLVGGSPALIVDSGTVVLKNVTARNATNAPTVVVNGGSLRVRDSVIEESTGYAQAAVWVNGGTVDLGTAASPGGNRFVVTGGGHLIHNAGAGAASAIGNAFVVDGSALAPGYTLEDAVYDYLDDPRAGLVTVDTSGNVYVTAASGSVQRGVDVAAPGAAVFVQGALKGSFAVGTKPLTVAFQDGTTLALGPDPVDPGRTVLVVTGTPGDDKVLVNPGNGGDLNVSVNALPTGSFRPTGRLVVRGAAGNDDVQVAGGVTTPAWLYGDTGDDRLKGGGGHNALLGGDGNDSLLGGDDRDLLIGGLGADNLNGNGGEDVLIAGVTSYDADEAALAAALAEWSRTDRTFAQRVADLQAGGAGTLNGAYVLTGTTVFGDSSVDTLKGGQQNDWFLYDVAVDPASDLSAAEAALALNIKKKNP